MLVRRAKAYQILQVLRAIPRKVRNDNRRDAIIAQANSEGTLRRRLKEFQAQDASRLYFARKSESSKKMRKTKRTRDIPLYKLTERDKKMLLNDRLPDEVFKR